MEINLYLIQAAVSILTATIVAIITLIISNKRYYEQQWWTRKAEKYEEILKILGKLKRIYDELNFQTSDGSNMNHKNYPEFIDLKTQLKIELATASFYMDKESINSLEALESRFFDEYEEFGFCPDNELVFQTTKKLEEVIENIIKKGKQELKSK